MNRPCFIVLLASAWLWVGPAALGLERVVRQSYPAAPGCAVALDTYRGSIDIEPGDGPEIRVEVRLSVGIGDESRADRILSGVQLTLVEHAGTVTIKARNPAARRPHFSWSESDQAEVAFLIHVPRSCNLDLATGQGAVTVGNLAGQLRARSRKGTLYFRQIDGSIAASSDNGDVVVSHCTGALALETARGDIRVGTVRGAATLRARSGDIDVQHALGGIAASAEAGDVTVGFPKELKAEGKLTTNGGAIIVHLDPATHCAVQASSVWGRVHTRLPWVVDAGGDGGKRLAARLNGGGPLLALHADGGQVHIDPPPAWRPSAGLQ